MGRRHIAPGSSFDVEENATSKEDRRSLSVTYAMTFGVRVRGDWGYGDAFASHRQTPFTRTPYAVLYVTS